MVIDASRKLKDSIYTFRSIKNEADQEIHFFTSQFKDIIDSMYADKNNAERMHSMHITGEISKHQLGLCLSSIKSLDQLKEFNEKLQPLNNIKIHFINIVISLICQIFKSIPEEDVEVSSESNDILSYLMRNLINQQDKNKIIIYVKHIYGSTKIIFRCLLKEEPKTIISPSFNPNEKEEENKSKPLLEKKQK